MRLVTFTHQGSTRVGAVEGDAVVDLAAAVPAMPRDMNGVLAARAAALGAAHGALAANKGRIPLAGVRLEAPVPRPGKFLAIGLNYADHVAESGMEKPWVPVFFNKQATCVVGPSHDVHLPRASSLLDYEGELAFVIGRRCLHVPRGRAGGGVDGSTVVVAV